MIYQNWYLRLLCWEYRILKALDGIKGKDAKIDMSSYVNIYKEIWKDAAQRMSADFSELSEGIWKICHNDRMTIINNYKTQIDDPVVLNLAGNKPLCYRLMIEEGLPVPEHQVYHLSELYRAKQFMQRFKGEFFVVKPANGTSAGRGVTTHISSFKECCKASILASLYSDEIIIERLISGECYRLLILNGQMIHASRRRGIRVKGDGKSTLSQLIEGENIRRKESVGNGLLRPIRLDRDLNATVKTQGLSIESIPNLGQDVLVKSFDNPYRKNVEVCTFYDESVAKLICRDICSVATRAAGIICSKLAGIDVITVDPAVPLEKSGGVISEINTTPGLHNHYHLLNEEDPPPAVHVLNYLLKMSNE